MTKEKVNNEIGNLEVKNDPLPEQRDEQASTSNISVKEYGGMNAWPSPEASSKELYKV